MERINVQTVNATAVVKVDSFHFAGTTRFRRSFRRVVRLVSSGGNL